METETTMTSTPPPIREWAQQHGFTVAIRGRLSSEIHSAYQAEFGMPDDRPQGAAQCSCGRIWTAARECHCTVCHRHFSSVRYFDEHRRGYEVSRTTCTDPLTVTNASGEPKYRLVDTAWGKLVVSTAERPDDSYGEGTLL